MLLRMNALCGFRSYLLACWFAIMRAFQIAGILVVFANEVDEYKSAGYSYVEVFPCFSFQ